VVGELALLVIEQGPDDSAHGLGRRQAGREVRDDQVSQRLLAKERAGQGERVSVTPSCRQWSGRRWRRSWGRGR
jgi:hypothetical protein